MLSVGCERSQNINLLTQGSQGLVYNGYHLCELFVETVVCPVFGIFPSGFTYLTANICVSNHDLSILKKASATPVISSLAKLFD